MLAPWSALNRRHLATALCAKGVERKRRRLSEEDQRESTERAFQAYGQPLETVTSFKYLRRVMNAGDNYRPVVVGNLGKDNKICVRLTRILVREGADPRVSGMFFKTVFQAVLLFGSETWVLTPHMEWDMDSFQHRFPRRITGSHPRRWGEGGWEYPPLTSAMEETVSKETGVYIQKRQNTAAQYIATRPILNLCERSVWRLGAWVSRRWWKQKVLDIGGEREQVAAETEIDGEEEAHIEELVQEETTGRS